MNLNAIYLEGKIETNDKLRIPPETLIALFVLQCCEDLDVTIIFTIQNIENNTQKFYFPIDKGILKYKCNFLQFEECSKKIQNCFLPAVEDADYSLIIVGLSASVRYLLNEKCKANQNHVSRSLLGFRQGCLQSCAEASIWTKFCEIEAVEMLRWAYACEEFNSLNCENILVQILKFEYHLQQPPILHNALKKKQEFFRNVTKDKEKLSELKNLTLKELPELEHKYAEGTELTLADVFLYVSFMLCCNRLKNVIDFQDHCPLVLKWLALLNETKLIKEKKYFFDNIFNEIYPLKIEKEEKNAIQIPYVQKESLYKSDPNRYNPKLRSYTHQDDVEKVRKKLEQFFYLKETDLDVGNLNNIINVSEDPLKGNDYPETKENKKIMNLIHSIVLKNKMNWDEFPEEVVPLNGDLPLKRLERKCQQLESLAHIIISLAQPGDKIVDFCSGGGHLGILLAFILPECKILLVENKLNSLSKAMSRIKSLKLQNVEFYQCNLDYFNGKFDIGVCLHACGAATDLVLQKCLSHNATFVCSPCCYGSLKPNHILNYPRSIFYKDIVNISLPEYLIMGHAADQTHDKFNPKTEQGKVCMQHVDHDRLYAAKSVGYSVLLCIMNPSECTPKNHILVGVHQG